MRQLTIERLMKTKSRFKLMFISGYLQHGRQFMHLSDLPQLCICQIHSLTLSHIQLSAMTRPRYAAPSATQHVAWLRICATKSYCCSVIARVDNVNFGITLHGTGIVTKASDNNCLCSSVVVDA
ncbi:hypothetical protein WUBG_04283 [Wuchereria bancrofti]|uniref:Uncharacterized protein n=1 Tax=Wuchereria bancrofti TaxID=6293 RepID=J9EQK1_WUCBA|nr:hypothetical protein WUBG_04283 [Wuchereria bancrofti]